MPAERRQGKVLQAVDVAVEHGCFTEEGVRVRRANTKSDATLAGLVSGEVQLTAATGSLARDPAGDAGEGRHVRGGDCWPAAFGSR